MRPRLLDLSAASLSRRWLWRHPHRALWRSLVHWRHTGELPWKQTATGLVFFNPRPLDDALKAGLMTTQGRYYQAIIKVNPTDTPERQASDIADGIGYACALLLDEHGWSAERVADLLERVLDEVADSEAQRG